MPLSALSLFSQAADASEAHAPRPAAAGDRARASAAMERYADGDVSAFVELYETLSPRILGFLLRLCRGDRSFAEDLLQLTFLHMHRARGSFAKGADVLPWAYAIARRLFLDAKRRTTRESTEPVEDIVALAPGVMADQEGALDAKTLADRLALALRVLPDSQRVTFELVKVEGLTTQEAAAVLGISESAVKVRTHRASEALRQAARAVVGGRSAR